MPFAIIRHEKIKDGRHLVAVGLHNLRGVQTPNADPEAEPVKVLLGSHKPWQDVRNALHRMGIQRIRKNGNVAFEVVLTTSPEYWTDRGWKAGAKPDKELQAAIDDWSQANLDYLRGRFGDLLVSVVLHLDERTPHLHALFIPAQFRADGRARGDTKGVKAWRLSAEKAIQGPRHLKTIVTEYAEVMARFGLMRGEDRATGTVDHKPLRVWQQEQAKRSEIVGSLIVEQIESRNAAAATSAIIMNEAKAKAAAIIAKAENVRATVEAERQAVANLRQRLADLLAFGERLLSPIVRMASEWRGSSTLIRQALGVQGTTAVDIVESVEVQTIMWIRDEARPSI